MEHSGPPLTLFPKALEQVERSRTPERSTCPHVFPIRTPRAFNPLSHFSKNSEERSTCSHVFPAFNRPQQQRQNTGSPKRSTDTKLEQSYVEVTTARRNALSDFRLRFHIVFSIVLGRMFYRFAGCPTFDLTSIYNVFVGSGIFCKVWKSSQTGHQQWSKLPPKMTPTPSKHRSKN